MYDKQIMKRCVNLAKAECANCYGKDCVPKDRRCHLVNARYPTIAEGALDCDWFLEAVLPLDKELCKEVWQALNGQDGPTGDRTRWCAICNASFIPTSPQ